MEVPLGRALVVAGCCRAALSTAAWDGVCEHRRGKEEFGQDQQEQSGQESSRYSMLCAWDTGIPQRVDIHLSVGCFPGLQAALQQDAALSWHPCGMQASQGEDTSLLRPCPCCWMSVCGQLE